MSNHQHKLNFACLECVRDRVNERNKLLVFVRSLAKRECCNICECVSLAALELLMEMGEE